MVGDRSPVTEARYAACQGTATGEQRRLLREHRAVYEKRRVRVTLADEEVHEVHDRAQEAGTSVPQWLAQQIRQVLTDEWTHGSHVRVLEERARKAEQDRDVYSRKVGELSLEAHALKEALEDRQRELQEAQRLLMGLARKGAALQEGTGGP